MEPAVTPSNAPSAITSPTADNALAELSHFVGGQAKQGTVEEAPLAAHDPSTGKAWATFHSGARADLRAAVRSAREGLVSLSTLSPLDRGRMLSRIARLVEDQAEDLAELTVTEVGKPLAQARTDVAKAIDWFDYAAGWPTRLDGSVPAASTSGRWAYTLREPIGVVAAIVPWNYPLMLSAWKVAPALAAGCGVVLKPSELTPASALRLAEIAAEAGAPAGALNVVVGDSATGEALVTEEIDKVSFTGSVEVGRRVASLAGAAGKAVTLELGGKSAAVVAPDLARDPAALKRVLEKVTNEGVLHNAGQACNAAGRLIVPSEAEDTALKLLGPLLDTPVVGPPREDITEVGPLVSAEQRARVEGFVDRAAVDGAKILGTGRLPGGGYYYRPGAVRASPEAEIAREEVFGPVLTVLPYRSVGEAVTLANRTSFGLAAGIFSRDLDFVHRVARQLCAGHVYVNHWSTQDPTVPFGGRRSSGLGSEHGREGIDSFLVSKSVWLAEDEAG